MDYQDCMSNKGSNGQDKIKLVKGGKEGAQNFIQFRLQNSDLFCRIFTKSTGQI